MQFACNGAIMLSGEKWSSLAMKRAIVRLKSKQSYNFCRYGGAIISIGIVSLRSKNCMESISRGKTGTGCEAIDEGTKDVKTNLMTCETADKPLGQVRRKLFGNKAHCLSAKGER